MLVQIREFIRREGIASVQQLSREFRIEASALKPMLDLWIKKGGIEPCQQKPACFSQCSKCQQTTEYYQITEI